jgi:N-acetylneuraminate epimerase
MHRKLVMLAATTFAAAAQSASLDLKWSQLPPLPDRLGVAGAFAGQSGGTLLVAGGANFPDKMPWEGGQKVWHDSVYGLDKTNGAWQLAGKLPRPLGYGVSLTTQRGVLCIGGSDAERHHAEVFPLRYEQGKLTTESLPSLPLPLANGAGALVGELACVSGGSEKPGEQSALNRFFALDLQRTAAGWREVEPCPGEARILAAAAAWQGSFYLVGGTALRPSNGAVKRNYLRDAWRFTPGKGWAQLPDLPRPCVAAPSPAPVTGSRLLLVGGDDGSLTGFQPLDQHPGFPRRILALDLAQGRWTEWDGLPAARATLPAVQWNGIFVLPSGEMRPGVRSPEVWTFSANGRR